MDPKYISISDFRNRLAEILKEIVHNNSSYIVCRYNTEVAVVSAHYFEPDQTRCRDGEEFNSAMQFQRLVKKVAKNGF